MSHRFVRASRTPFRRRSTHSARFAAASLVHNSPTSVEAIPRQCPALCRTIAPALVREGADETRTARPKRGSDNPVASAKRRPPLPRGRDVSSRQKKATTASPNRSPTKLRWSAIARGADETRRTATRHRQSTSASESSAVAKIDFCNPGGNVRPLCTGTVINLAKSGCLYCAWLPVCRSKNQPWSFKALQICAAVKCLILPPACIRY